MTTTPTLFCFLTYVTNIRLNIGYGGAEEKNSPEADLPRKRKYMELPFALCLMGPVGGRGGVSPASPYPAVPAYRCSLRRTTTSTDRLFLILFLFPH